jgi:sporulation protein YunB
MIECTDKNIFYKKRPKNKKIFSVFLVVIILISSLFYYRFVVLNNIFDICATTVYSYSNDAVNSAILKVFKTGTNYQDFIKIEKNENGEITLISADSNLINVANKEIVKETKTSLDFLLKNGIKIPFMAFSGIKILSGYGKKVNFKAITIDSVNSDFQSEFKSVGINQTLHSIYLVIVCDLKINNSIKSKSEKIETKVLISESILVGRVPEVYFGENLFK